MTQHNPQRAARRRSGLAGLFALACLVLAACDTTATAPPARSPQQVQAAEAPGMTRAQAARSFQVVQRRLEPVAERECRARSQGSNCDFKILVDDRPNQPPNAYQTLDKTGRPLIVFTESLLTRARNTDEVAFVMGHEAAHHIAGHLGKQRQNMTAGVVIFTGLAVLTGGDANAIRSAQEIGALVGSRSYSKEFELEADALGTVITHKAGFDPVRGAEFFNRIPDPGDRFLGTHPPNADRIRTVRETAARL